MKYIDGVMVNMIAYIVEDHGPSSCRIKPTNCICCFFARSRRGRVRMVVGFTTTFAISAYHHLRYEFESCSGEVYSIQRYAIKFISDLGQVGGFLPGTPVSSTNKTDIHDITKILLKVGLALNTEIIYLSIASPF